ncbi:hypothetical protein INR49_030746 [Caranx melampygus]|nr:hypothetical protein INR49_030746 [Caranx melampygus]
MEVKGGGGGGGGGGSGSVGGGGWLVLVVYRTVEVLICSTKVDLLHTMSFFWMSLCDSQAAQPPPPPLTQLQKRVYGPI